ncbi:5523_t:CDS:2 [Entrophospora sp. SA101]|nr:5523_t:CDS:2 [Entrophospora sp. SA101]
MQASLKNSQLVTQNNIKNWQTMLMCKNLIKEKNLNISFEKVTSSKNNKGDLLNKQADKLAKEGHNIDPITYNYDSIKNFTEAKWNGEHYEPFNEAEDNEGFDTGNTSNDTRDNLGSNRNIIGKIQTCDTATITTDLWTARSKVGYIGVTCHWLTPDFELVDVLLAIEKMPYPHSNQTILEYLKNNINEFGLEGKLICGITDNGSNMKKAFELWEEVERIPCTAHVLQLTINKALGSIKPYVKRFKKLVKFFTSSPKQTERLNNAQLEISVRGGQQQDLGTNLNNINILRNVAAVKTRWNASYNSWVRLLKLRKSIEWLANTLPYEPGKDSKSDARRMELVKQILAHLYKYIKLLLSYDKPIATILPMPFDKLFGEDKTTSTIKTRRYSLLFDEDSDDDGSQESTLEFTQEVAEFLSEKLKSISLPDLSHVEQAQLLALVDTIIQV